MKTTLITMTLASLKSAGENTLDMLEIMTRAFDESDGGHTVTNNCAQCLFGSEICGQYWVAASEPRPGLDWVLELNCEVSCHDGMWMSPMLEVKSTCSYEVN
jgi:hypothetical protein